MISVFSEVWHIHIIVYNVLEGRNTVNSTAPTAISVGALKRGRMHNPSFYFIITKGIVMILKFYTIDIDYIKYLYSFDTEVYFNKKDMIMKINLILVQLFSMMKFHTSFF